MDEAEAKRLVELYADMIVRISYSYLKRTCDAEDICQTVFLKFLTERRVFDSQEHEKAWIIRATVNACKDTLKARFSAARFPWKRRGNSPRRRRNPICWKRSKRSRKSTRSACTCSIMRSIP